MSTLTDTKQKTNIFDAKGIAQIGVLTAIATVLMLFEFPLWFAPNFYKIDLSDVPILIGSFALGPIAGLIMELIKNLLNLLINGTTTGGIGELSNFIIGCALVMPSAIIYMKQKTKKGAIIALITGTVCIILVGSLMNAYVLLPVYAKVFHMPMEALLAMGTAVNPNIKSLPTFVIFAVAPFNLLKGAIDSVLAVLIYKKVSPILHK
jgi:riboflavin transporter FmnP